jgi:hypothetical protein
MRQWWTMDVELGPLPMVFNKVQRKTLEDLTGRIPIFLKALRNLRLGDKESEQASASSARNSSKCSNAGDDQIPGPRQPASSADFAELVQKLWRSPEVILAEDQICEFMLSRHNELRNTPPCIEYVAFPIITLYGCAC